MGPGGPFAQFDGLDDRSGSDDRIPAGKNALQTGFKGAGIDLDEPPAGKFNVRTVGKPGIELLADARQNKIGRRRELRSGDRNGTPPSGCIGCPQFVANTPETGGYAVFPLYRDG